METNSYNISGDTDDGIYAEAVAIVREQKNAGIAHLQRRLRLGYNRAARLIETMEREGVVSKPSPEGKRTVLVGANYN